MRLNTASGVISFVRKIESDGADFYEKLSLRYDQGKDVFQALARENKKNVTEVERAYYSVITDAIEGCFSFDMDTDLYAFDSDPDTPADFGGILDKALQMEEKMIGFYTDAAGQSDKLMADVPRVFKIIVKKRNSRLSRLRSLG